MILILQQHATHNDAEVLLDRLKTMGFQAVKELRDGRIIIAVVSGIDSNTQVELFRHLPLVENVELFSQQFKLSGNDLHSKDFQITIGNHTIGGDQLTLMAGPCSIESEAQIFRIAEAVAESGAQFLRGGAFKPRTSPYDFQGLGKAGLRYIHDAARQYNLLSVSEVMDLEQLEASLGLIDVLQVGARNMQNYSLLKELGKVDVPVLLKRGFAATYKEWLMAAEYILNAGNPNVILCERGIRTYETYTRNTLDIAAVPVMHELSHLPVIVDPSHGVGIRKMVMPMAHAAVAAGADGLMVEVHYDPDNSYSDAQQALGCDAFFELANKAKQIHAVVHQAESVPSFC